MAAAEGRKDFFVSYTGVDRQWAEWIAWVLEEAGHTVVLQAWDFRPGSNFVLAMQQAAEQAERTIAVLSPDLLASRFTAPEWAAAFAKIRRAAKSQLAIEYAYRFKDDYDVGWWLRAEDPVLLAGDCAALARAFDLPEKDAREQAIVIAAVRRWLEGHGRWLLVYDNAEDPKVVRDALPRTPTGHVLITSRNPAWGSTAQPLPLDRWPRTESIRFLRERRGEADDRAADRVADALGNLPLALEQAAAYCEQTGMTLSDYADLLEQGYGAELWREPRDLKRTVAAVWEVSFSKVEAESPAGSSAVTALRSPRSRRYPSRCIRKGAALLPEPLKGAAARPVAFNAAVGALFAIPWRGATARRCPCTASFRRSPATGCRPRSTVSGPGAPRLLMTDALPGFPHDAFDAGVAAVYDRLQPHALAAAEHAEARGVALEAVAWLNCIGFYRWMRADLAAAQAACERALVVDEKAFGPDHPHVMRDVNNLGSVLHDLGDLDKARKAYQRALTIFAKVLGPDHPQTQTVRGNLAALAAPVQASFSADRGKGA